MKKVTLADIPIIREKPVETEKMKQLCEKYNGFMEISEKNNYGNVTINFSRIEPSKVSNNEYVDIGAYIIYKCLSALYISGKYNKKRIIAHGQLKDCSIKHFSLKFYKFVAHILETTFPERLEYWYIYGSSKFFRIIWNMMYKFIDPVTREKFFLMKKKYIKQNRVPPTAMIEYILGNDCTNNEDKEVVNNECNQASY